MRLLALLIGLLLTSLPATAHAVEYPGQHEPPEIAVELVERADDWWSERGRGFADDPLVRDLLGTLARPNSCGGRAPIAWQAPNLDDAWGRGDGATCEIWLSDWLVSTIDEPFTWQKSVDACTAVTHEVGHARGHPHTRSGVMAGGESKPPRRMAWAPSFCIRWGRSQFAATRRGDGWSEREIRRELGRPPRSYE